VRFEERRRILSVVFRVDQANALEATVHAEPVKGGKGGGTLGGKDSRGGSGEEGVATGEWDGRLQREAEARQNARQRRAAGNQQIKRKEAAEEAEASQTDADPAGESAGVESGGGGVAAAAAGAAADGALPAESVGAAPVVPAGVGALLGLSNSIMFELEEL